MEPMAVGKIIDSPKVVNKKMDPRTERKRERDGQYPSRALLPETLSLLYKKWEIANRDGRNVVKQKDIIHRAIELISDEELHALRQRLVTPKVKFNERFEEWRGGDTTKTEDDFKAHLLMLLESNGDSTAKKSIEIASPFGE